MARNSLLPTVPALHVSSVSRPLIWIKTCTQSLSSASSRLSAAAATDILGSATPTNATVKMFAGARPSAAGRRLTPHPDTAQSDFFDNNVDTPVLSYNLKGSSSWNFDKPLPLRPSHSHSHTSYSTSTTSTMARTPSCRSKPKRQGPDLGTLTTDQQQLTLHANDSDDQESDFLDTPVVAPREHTQRSFAQDHHLFIIKNDTQFSPQSQNALDSELLGQDMDMDMDMDGFIGFIPIMLVTDDVRK